MRDGATLEHGPAASATACGPEELLRLKARHAFPCTHHFYSNPPQIVRGEGVRLFDHEGREYLDCLSGVGVMNAGHCNGAIVEPAIEQVRTLQHTTTIYLTEPMWRLAEALAEIAAPLTRAFFCASGSEATDYALTLALACTGRPKIIAFENSLHGRTRWAMNATGLPMWRGDPYPSGDVLRVPFGDTDAVGDALRAHPGEIAAVVGEPVQGNGGINVAPDGFWPQVRELCDTHGALLVLDEVQTGFNRTGTWFAWQREGAAPDLMAISKGLGNGFPIAATLATDEVARRATRPSASTCGGNPVSAAAALATIEYHRAHDLGKRALRLGAALMRVLRAVAAEKASLFGGPRGLGLMLGVPILGADAADAAARCDAILEALKDEGILAGKTGAGREVLTFMPPLVIDESDVDCIALALRAATRRTESEP